MITFILAVCGNVDYVYSFPQSPPSRAAWIEIAVDDLGAILEESRRLHGRRGLKSDRLTVETAVTGRRLHGRRGLKCHWVRHCCKTSRRRLHGRRGLKSLTCKLIPLIEPVAAFTGGVD